MSKYREEAEVSRLVLLMGPKTKPEANNLRQSNQKYVKGEEVLMSVPNGASTAMETFIVADARSSKRGVEYELLKDGKVHRPGHWFAEGLLHFPRK